MKQGLSITTSVTLESAGTFFAAYFSVLQHIIYLKKVFQSLEKVEECVIAYLLGDYTNFFPATLKKERKKNGCQQTKDLMNVQSGQKKTSTSQEPLQGFFNLNSFCTGT